MTKNELYQGIIEVGPSLGSGSKLLYFTQEQKGDYDLLLQADHYQKHRLTDHYWSSVPVNQEELQECMQYQTRSPVITEAGLKAFLDRHRSEIEKIVIPGPDSLF
jgi:hypothetical protein